MASLEKRNGRFRVVFCFGGKKFTQSLKTSNERTATLAVARLEDNLSRVELGYLPVPDGVDLTTFLLSDGRLPQRPTVVHAEQAKRRTLGELLDKFLASFTPGALEPSTEHCLRIHAGHFKRIFGAKRPLDSIDLAALQDYIETRSRAKGLRGKKLSPTTIKKEIGSLTTIWIWGQNRELVDRSLPKKGLRFPKTADKPPFQTIAEVQRKIARGRLSEDEQADLWDCAFLTLPEIDELLEHVRQKALHPFLYPMFVVAAHTGARRSEMRRSQIEDLDLDGKRIFIRERKRVQGRHTLRSVPTSPLLETVLRDWLDNHPGGRHTFCLEAIVPKSSKIRLEPIQLTCEEAGHHFEQVLLGTKWAKLRGWHVFRHSFCSNCAAKGIDQRMINAWVGHQTEDMVRRYRHLIPNQEHSAIQTVFGTA
jgi:integrase